MINNFYDSQTNSLSKALNKCKKNPMVKFKSNSFGGLNKIPWSIEQTLHLDAHQQSFW
jgi:hypothetical protein